MRATSVVINSKLEINFLATSAKQAMRWLSLDQKVETRREIKDVDFHCINRKLVWSAPGIAECMTQIYV